MTETVVDRLRRWANARERRNGRGGHGKTGTELLRVAADELDRYEQVRQEDAARIDLLVQRARDKIAGGLACIFCGCTENAACEGGCAWAHTTPPICTSCVQEDRDFRLGIAMAIDFAEGALLGTEPRRGIWRDSDYLVAILAILSVDGDRARRAALAEYARRPIEDDDL